MRLMVYPKRTKAESLICYFHYLFSGTVSHVHNLTVQKNWLFPMVGATEIQCCLIWHRENLSLQFYRTTRKNAFSRLFGTVGIDQPFPDGCPKTVVKSTYSRLLLENLSAKRFFLGASKALRVSTSPHTSAKPPRKDVFSGALTVRISTLFPVLFYNPRKNVFFPALLRRQKKPPPIPNMTSSYA